MTKDAKRFQYLDGLRGIACMQVVIEHYGGLFTPRFVHHLGFFANGDAAVILFFLMSGFVLTKSFEASSIPPAGLALKRVVRLMLPALVASYLAVPLAWIGQDAIHRAWVITGSMIHYAPFSNPIKNLSGVTLLLGYSDTSIFHAPWLGSRLNCLNSSLWTISTEIWGSAWILMLVTVRRRSEIGYRAMLIASISLIGANDISLFTIGSLMTRHTAARPVLGCILIICGLMLWSLPVPDRFFFFLAWFPGLLHGDEVVKPVLDAGAIAIFCGVLWFHKAQAALAWRPIKILGRLSFSIYLIHWPIMVAVGGAAYLAGRSLGHPGEIAFCTGVAVTIAAAWLFERHVDAPAIALSRIIGNSSFSIMPKLSRAPT